jgi:hypothetical protein
MTEFKFHCPQCGQQIQCATSYAGSQINCPICQKPIVVPQAPSTTDTESLAGNNQRTAAPKRKHKLFLLMIVGAATLLLAAVVIGVLYFLECRPILHISDKHLNVLAGNSLTVKAPGKVRRGEQNCLKVTDSNQLRFTNFFSVSAWFAAHSFEQHNMTIAGRAQNGPPWRYPYVSWLLRINNDSSVEADLGAHGRYTASTFKVPQLQKEQWYQVAMTYDGHVMSIYLNGAMIATYPYSGGIANTPGQPIIIGADVSESPVGDVFDGAIDEVMLFKRTLSQAEIRNLYHDGSRNHTIAIADDKIDPQ